MKDMLITWDLLKTVSFSSQFFLQGDYGIGTLKINLLNLKEEGKIRAIFCNESFQTETYVVEKDIENGRVNIKIPDELFKNAGKVHIRLIYKNLEDIILGSTQEVFFYVTKKNDWELLEPLIPEFTQKYAKDIIDELYYALNSSKEEFKNFVDELKGSFNVLSVEETLEIINKYKNQDMEEIKDE